MLIAIDPANGNTLKKYAEPAPDEILRLLEKVYQAPQVWKRTHFSERARLLQEAARVLIENQREYARTMADEMGKPFTAGRAEIEKCALVCENYADTALGQRRRTCQHKVYMLGGIHHGSKST